VAARYISRSDGLPRPVRRLLRFASLRAARAGARPPIGIAIAEARRPKLLAGATRLAPAALPLATASPAESRELMRSPAPSGFGGERPAFAELAGSPPGPGLDVPIPSAPGSAQVITTEWHDAAPSAAGIQGEREP
jgi:hypothetical protein